MNKQGKIALISILAIVLGAISSAVIWVVLKIMTLGMDLLWTILPAKLGAEHNLAYMMAVTITGGVIIGLWQKKFGLLPEELPQVMGRVKKEGSYPYDNLHILIVSAHYVFRGTRDGRTDEQLGGVFCEDPDPDCTGKDAAGESLYFARVARRKYFSSDLFRSSCRIRLCSYNRDRSEFCSSSYDGRTIWLCQQKTGDDRSGAFDVLPAGVYFSAGRGSCHCLKSADTS